jgi:N-acylneuraminate cytidylyltransferase
LKPIAIIPARGGSKRIPRKNIKMLLGKPIIGYAIENAISSGLFESVIVSTDDEEIAEISKSFGAEVPFFRTSELSDDFATTVDVIADTISNLGEKFDTDTLVCCIYPVTPLLRYERISQAITCLKNENWDYVFSGQLLPISLNRTFELNNSGVVKINNLDHVYTRTQDLSTSYYDAGQFYLGHRASWAQRKSIFGSNSTIIKMSKLEAIDVDTLDDWEDMETLVQLRKLLGGEVK